MLESPHLLRTAAYSFCPRCATPLEPFDDSGYRRQCPACLWTYWGNAKPTANALVERQGLRGLEVLFVRRALEPYKGMWSIPGGFIDLYEEPEQALRREMREETGLEVQVEEILGIWTDVYPYGVEEHRTLDIFYRVSVPPGAEAHPGDDAAEVEWFTLATLPPYHDVAFPSSVSALRAWVARWVAVMSRTS